MDCLPKRCLCTKLRYGNMMWSAYTAVSSVAFIILVFVRNLTSENIDESQARTVMSQICVAVAITVFISSLILLFALPAKRSRLFLPWLASIPLYILLPPFMILTVFIGTDYAQWENHEMDWVLVVVVAANSILCIPAEVCVVSYFLQLAKIGTKRNLKYAANLANEDLQHVYAIQPRPQPGWSYPPQTPIPPPPYSEVGRTPKVPLVDICACNNGGITMVPPLPRTERAYCHKY